MPKKQADLLNAEKVFSRLDRPPWFSISTQELSLLLNVNPASLWNWELRRTFAPAEPLGSHIRAGNKRMYIPAVVLSYLSRREGSVVEPWQWVRRWLAARSMVSATAEPGAVLAAVLAISKVKVFKAKWKMRGELFEPRMREIIDGVPET